MYVYIFFIVSDIYIFYCIISNISVDIKKIFRTKFINGLQDWDLPFGTNP